MINLPMKPMDPFEPMNIAEGDVTVKIYRHYISKTDSVSYMVRCMRHGFIYRMYRVNLADAITEAKRMASKVAKGENTAAKTSERDLSYYTKCERALNGVPLHVAVAFYLSAHVRPTKLSSVPLVVKDYLSHLATDETLSKPHLDTRRSHLQTFAEAFRSKKIQDIDSSAIDTYLHNAKWKPVTRANVRRSIVALFNYARRKGHINRSLRSEAELSESIRHDPTTPEIYSVAEMASLMNNASYGSIPFLALGAFAGIRSAEIMRMSWSHVDLERSIIRLTRDITKTGRERLVPMSDNLKAWLKPYADMKGNIMSGLGMSEMILRKAIRDALSATGTDWKKNGLRHSFASYYLAFTEDPGKTSLACGHSVEVLNSIYKAIMMGDTPITKALAESYFEIRSKG